MLLALSGLSVAAVAQNTTEVAEVRQDKYAVVTNSFWDNWFVSFGCKHSKKCTFYTLRFGCSFAAVNTIKPQLL